MVPLVGESFIAKNKKAYKISQVVAQPETGGVFTVLSNSQVPPNYHKKIPSAQGTEESRFAIVWDITIPGWREKT